MTLASKPLTQIETELTQVFPIMISTETAQKDCFNKKLLLPESN